jgi:ferredoxin/flavodoxin---NADP+ reductase
VVGWLKRGPTGVIGTNKSDAADTVRSLLADCAPGPGPAGNGSNGAARERLTGVLAARGVLPVSYTDWLRVEQAEMDLATSLGRGARVKLPSREAIDAACRPPGQ